MFLRESFHGLINSATRQPQIPSELIYVRLPMKSSPWWALKNICCPQPGVTANIPAQAQRRVPWRGTAATMLVGLQLVACLGVCLRMSPRGHRAGLVSGGQGSLWTAILEPEAVHLVHGLSLTRTNQGSPKKGHSPNKPRYTSRVAFRWKERGTKGSHRCLR